MSALAADSGEVSDTDDLPILEDYLADHNLGPSGDITAGKTYGDLDDDHDIPANEEGLECAAKHVYEGPKQCDCHFNWVDEYPDDLKQARLAADKTSESKRHAILVRNKKNHQGPKALQVHEIVVQSPVLKSILEGIIGKYPDIAFGAKEVVFASPFQPLFHYWDDISEGVKNYEDKISQSYLSLLFRVLDREMKPTIKSYRDLVFHSVITFDLLWTIFKPGDIVYEDSEIDQRMYRLVRTVYYQDDKESTFQLECRYIDWNGTKFGFYTTWKTIKSFQGPQAITKLCIYPRSYANDLENVQKIVTRGRRFHALAGCHYKAYRGKAIYPRSFQSFYIDSAPIFIDGRVIIDAASYFQYNPEVNISPRLCAVHNTEKKVIEGMNLSEDDLLLCVPHVRGYSLKQRKWVELQVKDVSDIVWNDGVFANLILPQQYKDLLFSIVQSKLEHNNTFDDFIQGKGQGVVLLLSGDPGVGKTLTAESAAEEMHKPLYTVTAGELGFGVKDVEQSLRKAFEIAAGWNAVLLLDEADVFLQQRSNHDFVQNQLVSIFLRTLEYYTGILFITTNRRSFIDKAFMSRIDLSLDYPSLDNASQKAIWKSLIALSPPGASEFTNDDWASFTKRPMNGREIKNAVKLAHLLANKNERALAPEHVKQVLEALHLDLWKEGQAMPDREDE